MCRSRRELPNEYLPAKIGVDTAANDPLEVWGKTQFIIHHSFASLLGISASPPGEPECIELGTSLSSEAGESALHVARSLRGSAILGSETISFVILASYCIRVGSCVDEER